jgi:hypothetical protein
VREERRARGKLSIILQSTVGGFSPEFMRKLPQLEQAMIGPFFYDYTVFAGDENFTVTEPNDIKFLEYFYARCMADDEATPAQQPRRGPGLISRIFRWMAQPI